MIERCVRKVSQQHPMENTDIQQYIQERVVKVDSEVTGSPATSTALIESYAEPDVYEIGIEVSDPGEEYVMSYSLRGLALIFNQEYFSPELRLPHRHGTKADKNNLLRRQEVLAVINDGKPQQKTFSSGFNDVKVLSREDRGQG
ncbi:caspase-6-like [Oncorhynchus keta]|uniref:caspase-6-like n=1 Tax=Oncorhynchus keta TaxID=8018 RepID=UPI00227CBA18|nr:caspase-6-like [Oncorhynchus keta]